MPASDGGRLSGGAVVDVDVAVIGAGVAGLVCALDVVDRRPGARVAVIDKGTIGSSGSTPLAQGGMAAAVGPDDSPARHAADTIKAGDGLCDGNAVRILCDEAPARVADLVARGAAFDREPDGRLHLAREGGQAVPRSVHTADATGAEIFRVLRTAATGAVRRIQGLACELAVAGGRVVGAWVLLDAVPASPAGPEQEAGLALVRAQAVMLATGGCGGMYAATTNRDGATADGVALAWAAGASLVDLEFVQFHPTALCPRDEGAGFWRVLLTESLRGAGATLVDRDGRRFMLDRHPDAELAPRHVVAKGILDEPGGAWLDATRIGAAVLESEFPTAVAGARSLGYDLAREPVPVEPAEHYMIGGVATDLWGATSVPGLWAAGEVACAGVHGANRMAGNSLAQACVFGHRTAVVLAERIEVGAAHREEPDPPALAALPAGSDLRGLRADLRRAMSAGAGPIRSDASLAGAALRLDELDGDLPTHLPVEREAIELRHMLTVGGLMVRSARLRAESRGVHWREDAPGHAPAWSGVRLRVQRDAVPYPGADGGRPPVTGGAGTDGERGGQT